jgi:hypothetical protein
VPPAPLLLDCAGALQQCPYGLYLEAHVYENTSLLPQKKGYCPFSPLVEGKLLYKSAGMANLHQLACSGLCVARRPYAVLLPYRHGWYEGNRTPHTGAVPASQQATAYHRSSRQMAWWLWESFVEHVALRFGIFLVRRAVDGLI